MAHAAKGLISKDRDDVFDIANARLIRRGPARSARLSLRTLREGARLSQEQVSKKSGLAQSEISKLETASTLDDRMVSTLRRYLAAIGADLELLAASTFGHRIAVVGAHPSGVKAQGKSNDDTTDPLDAALSEVARLTADRARKTGLAKDVRTALILEAAFHIHAHDSKRGAAVANAANRYLNSVPARERLNGGTEMMPASEWTGELRREIGLVLEIRNRGRVTSEGLRRVARGLCDKAFSIIPMKLDMTVDAAAPRLVHALASKDVNIESVLRAMLGAVGINNADVQRLTKAEYVRNHRAKAKRRQAKAK
jgi:transcriptional regulator with XRE-family HTH domain